MSKPSVRGKETGMNRAEEDVHRMPRHETKIEGSRGTGSDVGEETKFSRKAWDEGPGESLHGAVKELGEQHPIEYHDHGPHHGTDHHIRHKPLHGMTPSKKY